MRYGRKANRFVGWAVMATAQPNGPHRRVFRAGSEVEAREMVARLNAAVVGLAPAADVVGRMPLYWCEFWDTRSCLNG